MTDRIVSSLTEGKQSVKETFRSWREKYLQDTDQGTLDAMQICVDVSGYGYVFQPEDLENVGNSREFVREKIIKTNYRETDVFSKPAVLKRLYQLFELMIAHNRQELLQNNIWLNKLVRLLVAFCEADDDECKMVAGYLSTVILVHLTVVRKHVQTELDKLHLEEDPTETEEIEKRERYVLKMSKLLLRNIEAGCGYIVTLPMIAELFCRLLEVYPTLCVLENSMLDMIQAFLQHRHGKMFSTVANCLKGLLNPELQSPGVIETVAKFFIESAGTRFIQCMLNHRSSEKVAMEVIVSVQKRSYGKSIFDKDVTEKLRQQMFHGDDIVRGYAIDFHVFTLCHPDMPESNNSELLQHILKLYERYEHTADALSALVADLWRLEFFDDWHILFDLLVKELARKDNLFMVITIVHVINQCHRLLLQDLTSAERSEERARLRSLLKHFLVNYPQALRDCIPHQQAYIALLTPANAAYHEKCQQFHVNVDQYYEALFSILEFVAQSGTNFYVLQKNLMVMHSYWKVIIDVEEMWSELLEQYTTEFFDTRAKLNSKNIGKDSELNKKYITCITKLVVFLELDHNQGSHLPNLMKILNNDFRLLDKMKLDSLQSSMFFRLYKCAFYTMIRGLQLGVGVFPVLEISSLRSNDQRLKRRIMELLRVLIKQLGKYDKPLDTSVHIFITLCDMLLMTQAGVAQADIAELQDIGYAVEPAVLEMMAKYLLNYLFAKQYDWQETPIKKQTQMLAKYIDLYQLHKSLPRITDVHYIVANFSVDTQFDKQLKQLMVVLHKVDPTQFCEVISQAAFQLLLVYKSESSVKKFLSKFQSFALTKLTSNNQDEYSKVIAKVVEKTLNHMMNVVLDADHEVEPARMLKLIQSLLPDVPMEERLMMENLLLRHPEYNRLTDVDRKAVDRFVKHLKK